jgi:quercetin dioxygenase-like cupin family protein
MLQVLGNPWTVKAATDQTGGTLAALEAAFEPGSGAPAHLHHLHHEEAFYVLSGEFLFHLGTQSVVAPAGTFLFAPRGIPHAELPPGPTAAARLHEIFATYDQEVVDLPVAHEGGQSSV